MQYKNLHFCFNTLSRNKSREGKILNLFTIVRFKNSACTGATTTQAGICYPYANCLLKSGTTDGSCALGEEAERLILPHLVVPDM